MHGRGRAWGRILFVSLMAAAVHLADWQGQSHAAVFTWNFPGPSAGVSATGKEWIALPATNALGSCGVLKVAASPAFSHVWRLDRTTDGLVECVCPGSDCFDLVPGESYLIQAASPTSLVVNGDDDSTLLPLISAGVAGSLSGTNAIALPRSVTGEVLPTANSLITSVGLPNVAAIQKYLTATDAFVVYTGRKGTPTPDFALVDGLGYIVRMTSTVYWGTGGAGSCSSGCSCLTGTFGSGKNATDLAADFCTAWNASGSPYTCAASGPGATLTGSGTCSGQKSVVQFTVPGGTTTAAHPFGFKLCCNSPLSTFMGIDGAAVVGIDDNPQTFGEIMVESMTGGSSVPATGPWGIVALVLSVLLGGVYLLARPAFRG